MSGPSAIPGWIAAVLGPHGILVRGVANFERGQGPLLTNGNHALALVLLGNAGGSIWPSFRSWLQGYNGGDPLDTWSKRVIRPLAEKLGATAYFPSDPPWQPFQQWAMRAEGLKPSPLGLLIHPQFGLWHGYRGALGFPFEIETSSRVADHPCDSCVAKPCLTACPVGAVNGSSFDVPACRSYLGKEAGRKTCVASGCLARNACPVGTEFRYPPEQVKFHMQALMG